MAKRKRKNHNLGLSPREHAEEAQRFLRNAANSLAKAERMHPRCTAIAVYTDAYGEATVAAVQARQALDRDAERQANRLLERAMRGQRTATRTCRR